MKILIAGDFCPQYRVAARIEKGDFQSVLGDVKDVTSTADYSIVNFECPIIQGGEKPFHKKGPNLHCSKKGAEAIKWAGFDCVTLANNHFYDYGEDGVKQTLETCSNEGLDVVGGGKNLFEASRILYKKVNDKILAIINCCEHEFSIATEKRAGSNPLNPIQQYYAIKEAEKQSDYILVIVHGGHELWQLPSPRMQETYRFFIDAGADAVVNHHQHCFSGYEIYRGRLIFYGLGNFCFDKPLLMHEKWNEGYMIAISFSDSIEFELYPYIQCSGDANVKLVNSKTYNLRLKELNQIIDDPVSLNVATEKYYASCSNSYGDIFEPIYHRFYFALKRRKLLPSFLSNKRKLHAENFVACESHRDKLLYFFRR